MTRFNSIALAAALSSVRCYEAPDDYPPEDVLCLTVSRGEVHDDDDDSACLGDSAEFAADGVGVADITVQFPGGSRPGVEVVVSTTLGVLDPSGATDAEKRKRKLMTSGRGDLTLPLHAGLESGVAIVTASIAEVSVERRVRLAPSIPTSLTLTANTHILGLNTALTSDITASLFVDGDKKRPSIGVDIAFLACEGTAESTRVELVPTVRTDASSDRVRAPLGLNAAGLAVINDIAAPDKPDVSVTVHAFGPGTTALRCDALDATRPTDSVELLLRRKPM